MRSKPKIVPLGDSSLLVQFGDEIDIQINRRVHALAGLLDASPLEGMIETVPAYATLAHRNVEAWLADHENAEEHLQDPARRERLMRPCNALSIAEDCGMPRETVRRKIVMLIDRGYVYRSEVGYLFLTRTVGNDFEDMTAKNVEELLATARRLEALLANQPTPLGPLRLK